MAGISTISGSAMSTEFKWSVANNLTGSVYNPVGNSGDIKKSIIYDNTKSNTTSGGVDEVFSFQQSIAASGSMTLDLTQMTNLLQQTAVNIARIKAWHIRLLSTTDDPTITPTPNANSTITVTNAGPSVPCQLDFGNGGSGLTLTLTGTGAVTGVAIGTAGTGYPPNSSFIVAPNQAGGSGCFVAVATSGSGVPTTVTLITGGAGYTAGTAPTTVISAYNILTGGVHAYCDPAALGFTLVDALHKNIRIINNDTLNGVTVEISNFSCTN